MQPLRHGPIRLADAGQAVALFPLWEGLPGGPRVSVGGSFPQVAQRYPGIQRGGHPAPRTGYGVQADEAGGCAASRVHTGLTVSRRAEVLLMGDEVAVLPLSERDMPWFARLKLGRARKRHQTGLLLSAIIRTGSRAITSRRPVVAIREGRRRLCMCSPSSKFPKFTVLNPGVHLLRFHASAGKSGSSFELSVALQPGEILIAVCEPVQPWVFHAKSPAADQWHIGVDRARRDQQAGSDPDR